MVGVIYVCVATVFGFYGFVFGCFVFIHLIGCFSRIVRSPECLFACVLCSCICPCSAQMSMFHIERRSRNTLIIIIIITIIINFFPPVTSKNYVLLL